MFYWSFTSLSIFGHPQFLILATQTNAKIQAQLTVTSQLTIQKYHVDKRDHSLNSSTASPVKAICFWYCSWKNSNTDTKLENDVHSCFRWPAKTWQYNCYI